MVSLGRLADSAGVMPVTWNQVAASNTASQSSASGSSSESRIPPGRR